MAVDRTGIKWSREEIILAFDLYCRTLFGKISQGNPEIIKLRKQNLGLWDMMIIRLSFQINLCQEKIL